jgi:hypothetical protein
MLHHLLNGTDLRRFKPVRCCLRLLFVASDVSSVSLRIHTFRVKDKRRSVNAEPFPSDKRRSSNEEIAIAEFVTEMPSTSLATQFRSQKSRLHSANRIGLNTW